LWTGTFFVLSVMACIACSAVSLYAVRLATRASESVRRRLSSCESRVELLEDSHREGLTLMADLANRLKMTRVRNANAHSAQSPDVSTDPDPYKDPEAWRKMMGRRMAEAKMGTKL